jgi:alpha-tubulin suppressor-like RCC1 family protein
MSNPDASRFLSALLARRAVRLAAPVLVLAALGCGEDADSPTAPGSRAEATSPDLAAAAATAPSFVQVSAGITHTCGVTAADRAYCWGGNSEGQLGDGTTTDRRKPRAVAGGLRFRFVSAGNQYTCGLTTNDRAYCWGSNIWGTLGEGSDVASRPTPVEVAGGRRYRQLRAGHTHACAVTLAEVTFCWGDNAYGQLGIGFASSTTAPVRVKTGGLVFRQVFAGGWHTCGLTAEKRVWCWGRNDFGQLGDGARGIGLSPLAVAGGHAFTQLSAGLIHTCGVTTAGVAYCWGRGFRGALGDGTQSDRLAPVPVAGGLHFSGVSAGNSHTCGVTLANAAYCWGSNGWGQLGDGTYSGENGLRTTPGAVVGGLKFARLSGMNGAHTCGVTLADRAYCWGDNSRGQLGDGTRMLRTTPVPVGGTM